MNVPHFSDKEIIPSFSIDFHLYSISNKKFLCRIILISHEPYPGYLRYNLRGFEYLMVEG